MWVITGVLLGLVVLASLIGFHVGPHAHLAAGVLGVLAAASLVWLAVEGSGSALLWVLFAGDLSMSAGVGYLAWRGLSDRGQQLAEHRLLSPARSEGVAVSDLDPAGIVRVQGEEWSAVAINAPVRRGSHVLVVGRGGVRLEVWGEEPPLTLGDISAFGPGEER
jgi:membrane-bound ClpP family serine protease